MISFTVMSRHGYRGEAARNASGRGVSIVTNPETLRLKRTRSLRIREAMSSASTINLVSKHPTNLTSRVIVSARQIVSLQSIDRPSAVLRI